MSAWETAFESQDYLKQYGTNALGLFALALKYGIDDLNTIAADSITDGADDKKCDIVYISRDDGVATVIQCYMAAAKKKEAPSNKASDLNTAASWLLQRPINDLPERIKSSAQEMRDGISSGEIKNVNFWYVHNLDESNNVKSELTTVEATANSAIKVNFSDRKINISGLEVGRNTLDAWYSESQLPILVPDELTITVPKGYEMKGEKWTSYVTAIPASFLHRQYKSHKTKLFSANIRDYLGSRQTDSNINFGIKNSAESNAGDFWVFNNGVTMLVNDYQVIETKSTTINTLKIKGISIVNGAQTTGAIGSLKRQPSKEVMVPARFVKTESPELIHNIIQYNNSQNKITASDFRSTDKVQSKLRDQISKVPDAQYEGGRRGSYSDAISRKPRLLPSYTVGQALAAFHGDPIIAYNHKSKIWSDDSLYSKYFNENTRGVHIVCAYALLRAVEDKKMTLVAKSKKAEPNLTELEESQLNYFRKRGSIYLFVAAIASSMETFLGRKIPNRFRISFKETVSPKTAKAHWLRIVDTIGPFCAHLEPALTDGLKSAEKASSVIDTFKSLVQATVESNKNIYKEEFASQILTS